jgi:hypothetical protein
MITDADRKILVDWCYGLVDNCHFSRDTVAMAMQMVDRFLAVPSSTTDAAARICDEALHCQ